LAVGYLLMAVLCLQTMSSAFLRAMGDKKSQAPLHAPSAMLHAQQLYRVAARIDPQNWRAYKGMGNLLFSQRYYSLEMDEKVRLAGQERSWYKKAYAQNPKDPETILALGKCLIFLGKHQDTRVDGGTTSVSSEGGGQRSTIGSGQVDDLNNQDSTTISQLQARGLELLREACSYRPFNDLYWWNLGVELRKVGRYKEALDVFNHAASIKRTPSTKKNIEWLKARLKASSDRREAVSAGVGTIDEMLLQDEQLKTNTRRSKLEKAVESALDLDTFGAVADPGLMDLLDKMGE
jgi:tetratricopeptide (TPR) repeat protein